MDVKVIPYPHGVWTQDNHFVGVAYAKATINHGSGHTRTYNTFVMGNHVDTYHVDMHIDAPDPSDPTSPSYWGGK